MPNSKPTTSFDLLCERVQGQINSASGEDDKHIHVERLGASDDDWERLMVEIDENDHVNAASCADGGVDLSWKVPKDL